VIRKDVNSRAAEVCDLTREFTSFRITWVHILQEHLSSYPSGAREFTSFWSTWVHIRFLVIFVFVFICLFFYVVFCRSLFVPFFCLLNIVFCRPSSIYGSDFPFGIFRHRQPAKKTLMGYISLTRTNHVRQYNGQRKKDNNTYNDWLCNNCTEN
jgi:hypothetical protein